MDILSVFIILLGSGGVWGGGPMVKMCSSKTVPKAKQYQAVSSEIVPKAKQSMGYMDLPSNPFKLLQNTILSCNQTKWFSSTVTRRKYVHLNCWYIFSSDTGYSFELDIIF